MDYASGLLFQTYKQDCQINRYFNQIISWNKSPEMRRKRRVSGILCVLWTRWMLRVN